MSGPVQQMVSELVAGASAGEGLQGCLAAGRGFG